MAGEDPGHAHLDRKLDLVLELKVKLSVPELGKVGAVTQHGPKVQ